MSAVLALDVGTSALKAVLFGPDGTIRAATEAPYDGPPSARQASARQNPEAWWQAARRAVQALEVAGLAGIVLTGTMENLIGVDPAGRPTADAVLYADPGGAEALAALRPALAAADAAAILGNEPEPLMTAFKWRHALEVEPALAGAELVLPGAADALALRLTGRATTDPVTATTAGLMDIHERRWSATLLAIVGLEAARLPAIVAPGTPIGGLLPDAARHLGLAAGTPVIQGCGDAGASTLGSFCDGAEDLSLHLGTTGWAARVAPAASLGAARPFYRLAHPWGPLVIEIAPILSAGAAVAWARGALGLDADAADRLAAEADAEPADLLFLPYLSGERSPFVDLAVRGAFLGLDAGHGPGDLMRAVLEGVALAVGANLDLLGRPGSAPALIGGGGAQPDLAFILADTLGCRLWVPDEPQAATAVGAYRLAARGLGRPDPVPNRDRMVRPRRERQARAARHMAAFSAATAAVRQISTVLTRPDADGMGR